MHNKYLHYQMVQKYQVLKTKNKNNIIINRTGQL